MVYCIFRFLRFIFDCNSDLSNIVRNRSIGNSQPLRFLLVLNRCAILVANLHGQFAFLIGCNFKVELAADLFITSRYFSLFQ